MSFPSPHHAAGTAQPQSPPDWAQLLSPTAGHPILSYGAASMPAVASTLSASPPVAGAGRQVSAPASDTESATSATTPSTSTGKPAKRARVSHACEGCKRRKVKCSGDLPCTHCAAFALQCEYKTQGKRGASALLDGASLPDCADAGTGGAAESLTEALLLKVHIDATKSTGDDDPAAAATAWLSGNKAGVDKTGAGTVRRRSRRIQPPLPLAPASAAAPTVVSETTFDGGFTAEPLLPPFPPSATPAPRTAPPATQRDIDEIADSMVLVVQLDDSGAATSCMSLGPSNGLHTLTRWTRSLSHGVMQRRAVRHRRRIPERAAAREAKLFPPRAFAGAMLDVYWRMLHQWQPIVDRAGVLLELEYALDGAATPDYLLVYAVLACGTAAYERQNGIDVFGPSPVLLSRVFAERAKGHMQRMGALHLQSIEGVQATLLLAYLAVEYGGNAAWVLSGTASRLAIDMGLSLDLRATPFHRMRPNLPLWGKTWAAVYAMDRYTAMFNGRPPLIQDADCLLQFEPFLATPENLAVHPADVLVAADSYFVWSVKLQEVAGKVLQTLNSITSRRGNQLSYSLPELHALLSRYRRDLPARLQFVPTEPDATLRLQAAQLNLRYYALVATLYRTVIAVRSPSTNPASASASASALPPQLKQQYLALLEDSLAAMLAIAEHIRPDLRAMPDMAFHELQTMLTICVTVVTHDHSEGRRSTANVLAHLDRIHALVEAAAEVWPFAARIMHLPREISATIRRVQADLSEVDANALRLVTGQDEACEDVLDLLDGDVDEQIAVMATAMAQYMPLADSGETTAAAAEVPPLPMAQPHYASLPTTTTSSAPAAATTVVPGAIEGNSGGIYQYHAGPPTGFVGMMANAAAAAAAAASVASYSSSPPQCHQHQQLPPMQHTQHQQQHSPPQQFAPHHGILGAASGLYSTTATTSASSAPAPAYVASAAAAAQHLRHPVQTQHPQPSFIPRVSTASPPGAAHAWPVHVALPSFPRHDAGQWGQHPQQHPQQHAPHHQVGFHPVVPSQHHQQGGGDGTAVLGIMDLERFLASASSSSSSNHHSHSRF
ncbi:hypothetical protein H9P43_003962 [Blastocladiella emersonii ATCC 22665]|nr:hypothetical protein H9P43_003962 [Blastocladiella emersonii ATCC 22665]